MLATVPPLYASRRPFVDRSAQRIREEINPSIRALAADRALSLNDSYDALSDAGMYPDGVHLDARGQRLLAESWATILEARVRPLQAAAKVAVGDDERTENLDP